MKKHYRHPAARAIAIATLILVILGVIFWEPIKSELIANNAPRTSRSLTKKNMYMPANYNWDRVKPVTMKDVLNAQLHKGDIRTVGQIAIPSDHLHLPIGLGVGRNTLMLAAGTMRPGERMGVGNYALAGHHMVDSKVLFTPLYLHARKGQMVYLTDMKNVYAYRIQVRKVLRMQDMGVIQNEPTPEVTLITCNSDRLTHKRLLVGGTLVRKFSLKQAPQNLKRFLASKPNNYQVLKGY